MRRSPLKLEQLPAARRVLGFEGGAVYMAEKGSLYYVILDESTMAAILDEDDLQGMDLVKVWEFESEAERTAYLVECFSRSNCAWRDVYALAEWHVRGLSDRFQRNSSSENFLPLIRCSVEDNGTPDFGRFGRPFASPWKFCCSIGSERMSGLEGVSPCRGEETDVSDTFFHLKLEKDFCTEIHHDQPRHHRNCKR